MGHNNHANSNHFSHESYSDYRGYESYNAGQPINLNWSNWPSSSISERFASDTVDKIKELRDKINYLQQNKGWKTINTGSDFQLDNPSLDWSGAKNEEFDGVGDDYIEDVQYDTIRDNLEILHQHIKNTNTNLPGQNDEELLKKGNFEALKAKIDQLALYDASNLYTNHASHESHLNYEDYYDHSNHTSHNSHGNHSNHSSHGNHSNHGNYHDDMDWRDYNDQH